MIRNGATVGGGIYLQARKKHRIRLEYSQSSGEPVARLYWSSVRQVREIIPSTYLYPGPPSQIYEAENAALTGVEVRRDAEGYTGTGYAAFTGAAGSSVEWSIQADSASTYEITFRYLNTSAETTNLALLINGAPAGAAIFFLPTSETAWGTAKVVATLTGGTNTIRLSSLGPDTPILDHLQFTAYTGPEPDPFITDLPGLLNTEVKLFPNPARDEFRLVNENGRLESVRIYNSLGATVVSRSSLKDSQVIVGIQELPAGVYFVEIHTSQGRIFSRKLIITR
jgi:predicted secreted protein